MLCPFFRFYAHNLRDRPGHHS
ncbi:MAG: hypothetical protein ACK57X_00945 [Bacteroidota bacterium]